MAVQETIVREILGFHGDQSPSVRPDLDLGYLGDGLHLRYDLFHYELRVPRCDGRGELRTGQLTTQPSLAIIEDGRVSVLAYPSDVQALGEPLALRVLDKLTAIRLR